MEMELSKHVTRMTRTRGEDGTCYKVDWFAPVQVQLELQESISRAHACLLKDQLDIHIWVWHFRCDSGLPIQIKRS